MKILYITTISDTINAFLIPHIKLLIEQGNEVGIACNILEEIHPDLLEMGCKIHLIPFQRSPLKRENFKAYRRINLVISKEKYELIHVHTPIASILTRFACRKLKGIKVIYTAHGFHFYKGAPLFNWLVYYTAEKYIAKWTDTIITMNDEDFDSAKTFNIRKKASLYKINGIGLDLKRFQPLTSNLKTKIRKEYNFKEKDFLLIYVGEMCFRKNQDMLIQVMKLVNNSIPDIKLLLVGDGKKMDQYKDMTKKLNLNNCVKFLGYRQDVNKLMSLADVVVSTSRQEGLPVNLMEGMATGLPLIVTNSRGNRDLVMNNNNGYVVELDEIDEFADKIIKLYYSPEIRKKFGDKNLKIIKQYSLDAVLKELREIYALHGVKDNGKNNDLKTMV
ncbi:glycosyltransferase family 4 protein [Evansella tamaricis]|uniref:Glycosyltransferase family 4 protein n=1 Tax=Evansella tamaricis TaxID=2069301 RepID=A0ABS6JET3_9BACI|nr:glycosyltransferase family 4 protein [Evansella tamaricis]MBU9712169.1 glycosyltransferase family 4 protein [Evansella tamaricis]